METFSPEDILVDNLSFKLNKGSSYITDRRNVRFYPSGSNVYKPTSGNRVLKFSLNAEDNGWLDPQSVRVFFTVQNLDQTLNKKLRPLAPPYSISDVCELLLVTRLLKTLIITIVFIRCFQS